MSGIADARFNHIVTGQNLASLRVYLDRANITQTAQLGKGQEKGHTPGDALTTEDQFQVVSANAGPDFRQGKSAYPLSGCKRSHA